MYTGIVIRLKTTQLGNPVIRQRSRKVEDVNAASVRKVIKDLTDSMRHNNLVGMAAPQIGKGLRIFVTEIRKTKIRKNISKKLLSPLRVYINPMIVSKSKKLAKGWEGCGSVASANLFGMVERADKVTVEALDEDGKKFRLEAEGLLARVIQHEVDHLNGIVFTDKADKKTYVSREEYTKLRK